MALVLGTNCGFVTTRPVDDPAGTAFGPFDTSSRATKDTSPVGAIKVTEIGVWVNNATEAADIDLGIYTDTGDNKPITLLAGKITISKGTTAGWKYGACDIDITPETIYWVAAQCDNTATQTNSDYGSTGTRRCPDSGTTELESTWGGSSLVCVANNSFAIYAVTSTGSINTQINIGDVWKDATTVQINIGDAWKAVTKIQVNIGDAWKTVFG